VKSLGAMPWIVAVTLMAAAPVRADVTLVMMRHGEKPAAGLGQLSCQGLNRSLALPDVLLARFGRPAALYAPNPGVATTDFGQSYNYIRPLATIEPTAIRLGLPVNTRWGLNDLAPLGHELLDPAHDGQVLFVAWEHNLLVHLARDLVSQRGGDPTAVPDWDRDDFDSLYLLSVPPTGQLSFRIEHEGLDGQSGQCPGEAHVPSLPRRASIDVAAVDAAIRDEVTLDHRADCVATAPDPWFVVDEGDAPILVTAAHVTRPFREGAYRFEDGGGTGALARSLNRLTGASILYTVDASPSDPNYYDDNEFKQTLDRLIGQKHPRFLLDIHASSSHRPYEVDLGTMEGASLLGQPQLRADLVAALRAEGLANLSLDFFRAAKQQSITKFAAQHGVPAIQLEINSTWLRPSDGDLAAHRFAQLLQALVRFVELEQPATPRQGAALAQTNLEQLRCASRLPAK
jgi:hypothetical protein